MCPKRGGASGQGPVFDVSSLSSDALASHGLTATLLTLLDGFHSGEAVIDWEEAFSDPVPRIGFIPKVAPGLPPQSIRPPPDLLASSSLGNLAVLLLPN